MYSRYVPPTKAGNPKPEQPPTTLQGSLGASSLYSRYVPAPKTAAPLKRKIVFEYDDEVSAPLESNTQDSDKRKPKKARRSLKTEVEIASVTTSASEVPKDAEVGEADQSAKKAKKKKSRRVGTLDDQHVEAFAVSEAKTSSSVPPVSQESATANTETKEKKKRKQTNEKEAHTGGAVEGTPQTRHKSLLEKKEKSLKRAQKSSSETQDQAGTPSIQVGADEDAVAEEVHGLDPLPQPEPVSIAATIPTYETLPPWLAYPTRVSPNTRASFTGLGISPDLGINAQAEKVLQSKGWNEAFAVQTAVIPYLLPSHERQGDVVISAATGSGKTLAYVLPMVRDISRGVLTRMRGLVVVPTRELVQQVQDVCETCSRAYTSPSSKRVKIGVAVGSQAFKKEQAALTEEEQVYDPEGYRAYTERRGRWPLGGETDEDPGLDLIETSRPLPQHVIRNISKVDILVCTPGRLVEHLNSTPGFTLDYVRWLIVDEADKLLGQSYQQWLDIVMQRLSVEKPGARDFSDSNLRGVRKVVLSATMTRDLGVLDTLNLSRPRHIILEGTTQTGEEVKDVTEYSLPDLLRESAIKVTDEGQKPLYLVELLQSSHMQPSTPAPLTNGVRPAAADVDDDATSSSGSDSDASELDAGESDDSGSRDRHGSAFDGFSTTALIFTKSNETALRLSRLLAILAPHLESVIGTLTSTTRTSERRKTIRAFQAGNTRILVASDLTARGIDLPDLDYVINYDMPPSAEVYVHRVGRTARAGRPGHAWTLFTKKEGGWFWPEVAGKGKSRGVGTVIKRTGKVEQVVIGRIKNEGDVAGPTGAFSDVRVAEYEAALEQLGQEAVEVLKKGDKPVRRGPSSLPT